MKKLKELKYVLFERNEYVKFLFKKNVLTNITNCKICNSEVYHNNKLFICKNAEYRKSSSVFRDTFFAGQCLAPSDIMILGYFWLNQICYTAVSDMTEYTSHTIVKYYDLYCKLVISTLNNEDMTIGGRNVIVEVDESKFKKNESW